MSNHVHPVSIPVAVLLTYFYAALIGATFAFLLDMPYVIRVAASNCVHLVQSSEFMVVSAILSWTGPVLVAIFHGSNRSRNPTGSLLHDLLFDVATLSCIGNEKSESASEPRSLRLGAILIACLHAGIVALEAVQSQSFMARVVWILVWLSVRCCRLG
jgi:hypothetical protein